MTDYIRTRFGSQPLDIALDSGHYSILTDTGSTAPASVLTTWIGVVPVSVFINSDGRYALHIYDGSATVTQWLTTPFGGQPLSIAKLANGRYALLSYDGSAAVDRWLVAFIDGTPISVAKLADGHYALNLDSGGSAPLGYNTFLIGQIPVNVTRQSNGRYGLLSSTGSAPPPAPTITAPTAGQNLADLTPDIIVSEVETATGYDYEIATDTDFVTVVASVTNHPSTTWTSDALTAFTQYYVRSRARNAAGAGEWSSTVAFQENSILATNFIAHWKADETSDGSGAVTRSDSFGTNHLTDVSPFAASTTGKISNAAQFVAANAEILRVDNNAALTLGNFDASISGWVYFDTLGTNRFLFGKGSNCTSAAGVELCVFNTSGKIWGRISDGTTLVAVDSGIAPDLATWYFVILWHNAAADTLNIQVNNGTPVSAAAPAAGIQNGNKRFNLGGSGTAAQYHDGRVDEVSMAKTVWADAERTHLYNAGAGRAYPFLA